MRQSRFGTASRSMDEQLGGSPSGSSSSYDARSGGGNERASGAAAAKNAQLQAGAGSRPGKHLQKQGEREVRSAALLCLLQEEW